MRTLTLILALATAAPVAAPAAAQAVKPPGEPQINLQRDLDARTVAGMQAGKQRDTSLRNELSTLQATIQTREVLSDIAAAGSRPAVPTVPFNPKARPPRIEAWQLARIPDSILAASNARAIAASRNKH